MDHNYALKSMYLFFLNIILIYHLNNICFLVSQENILFNISDDKEDIDGKL